MGVLDLCSNPMEARMPPFRFTLIVLAVVAILAIGIGVAVWQNNTHVEDASYTTKGNISRRFGVRDGQQFPVGREGLYLDYATRDEALDELFETDYGCRYSLSSRNCYCCGAFFHYIEQGKICTKFCLKRKGRGERPRFCQKRLIQLPFNFGDDNPDKVTLDNRQRWSDGTQVEFPYQESSAPRGCPQDPYVVEGTGDTEKDRKSSKAAKAVKAGVNSLARMPAQPSSTLTTTRSRRPKNSESSGSSGFGIG